jgi:hypothetical protein
MRKVILFVQVSLDGFFAETRTFGNGVVLLRYERLRPVGGASGP